MEMPHFQIGDRVYDVKAEKNKSAFLRIINIFRGYNKEKIENLLKQNKFLTLYLKSEFKKITNKEELINKLKEYGLNYIIDYIK